jgi:hypothetical protein
MDTLLPGMLLPMARGVARGGEGRGAGVGHRVRTGVFVLAQTGVLGRAPVERARRGFAGRARQISTASNGGSARREVLRGRSRGVGGVCWWAVGEIGGRVFICSGRGGGRNWLIQPGWP